VETPRILATTVPDRSLSDAPALVGVISAIGIETGGMPP